MLKNGFSDCFSHNLLCFSYFYFHILTFFYRVSFRGKKQKYSIQTRRRWPHWWQAAPWTHWQRESFRGPGWGPQDRLQLRRQTAVTGYVQYIPTVKQQKGRQWANQLRITGGKNISSNLQALKCNIATTCRNNLQYPPSLWCTFTSALLLTDDIFAHLIKTVLMIAYYGCATWVESIKFNFLCTTIMSDPVSWAHAVHCFLGLLYPTGSWLTPHIHIPPTLLDWISCFQKPAYIDICIGMLLSGCQLSLFSRKDS